jgi:transposase
MAIDEAMLKEFERLNRKIDQLTDANSRLIDEITNQSSLIVQLTAEIAAKDALIAELQRKNGMNSRNSSMPPSLDHFNKPKPSKINRGGNKPKKRSGGQVGHKGSTMRLKDEPDDIHRSLPSDCLVCSQFDCCPSKMNVLDSRSVVDMQMISTQSRYDRIVRTCPIDGRTLLGLYPEGVNAPMQYGPGLKALVVSLSHFGMVSANRIVELLEGMSGVAISDGTVCNILQECAKRCDEQVIPRLKEAILNKDIVHCDETGIRVEGKNHWAHTTSTSDITLVQSHPKRGFTAIQELGILPQYHGIAVHDCWSSYFNENLEHVTKAVCGAHIDRELQGVIENYEGQSWAKRMQNLLYDLYQLKQRLLSEKKEQAPQEVIQQYSETYDRIIRQGLRQNPYRESKQRGRGRPKRGKIRSLLERLEKLKDSVVRFFTDFRVPFSNNTAERSYRMFKVKQKVSGTFRSQQGGANFCSIYSFIDTTRKNGRKLFDELTALFSNSLSLEYLN